MWYSSSTIIVNLLAESGTLGFSHVLTDPVNLSSGVNRKKKIKEQESLWSASLYVFRVVSRRHTYDTTGAKGSLRCATIVKAGSVMKGENIYSVLAIVSLTAHLGSNFLSSLHRQN